MANQNVTALNPRIIDYCSITKTKNPNGTINCATVFNSVQNLHYVNLNVWNSISQQSPLNLMAGFRGRNHVEALLIEKIDGMINWLMNDPNHLHRLLAIQKTVFITYCGTVQTLMNMQEPSNEKTICYVVRFRNIVFLCEDKARNNSRYSPNQYKGEKLEQLLLSTDPNVLPDQFALVPSNTEFCPIYEVELKNSILVYGAAVDGVLRQNRVQGTKAQILQALNDGSLIELKTVQESLQQEGKLSKLYRQAVLTKCGNVLVVYKNGNDGRVWKKDVIETTHLQSLQVVQRWSAEEMMEELCLQTDFIDSLSQNKGPDLVTTFEIVWKCAGSDSTELRKPTYNILKRRYDNYELLPVHFVAFILNNY